MTIAVPPYPAHGWWERAHCRGMGDEQTEATFYSIQTKRAVAEALSLCARCDVIGDCLSDALTVESRTAAAPHGIRGGLLPTQRVEMMRRSSRESR